VNGLENSNYQQGTGRLRNPHAGFQPIGSVRRMGIASPEGHCLKTKMFEL
jgi:hypothetical protein